MNFGNNNIWFSWQDKLRSDFWSPVQICDDLLIFSSRRYFHILCQDISYILWSFMVDQVQVDEGWSVSATPKLKTFLVRQMSHTDPFPKISSFLYIFLFCSLGGIQILFENFGGLWYQFSQCSSCYEKHTVFLLKHSYYTVILCAFSEFFVCRCCILFKEINTKNFKFLSFIMILISFWCYLWFSMFENKELEPSCNKVVYQNRFAIGLGIQVNACLSW